MTHNPLIAPRSTRAREWQAADSQHYLHPFTDFKSLAAQGARIITRAEGVYLYDSDGERILDGMAGLWCVNVGYGRRELAEVAYRQMLELPYYNSFFKSAHPPAIELASLLAQVTPPQFKRVFYTGSGSEANDTIVRMVRRYWDVRGEPGRQIIISRENAYHGSTMAGASLGGMKPMHEQGGIPIPGIVHTEQPYWPLGAVMVSDRVADVLIDKGGEFHHGFTYSGHPVACAVAVRNIRILQDEGIVERVRNDTGPYLQKRWRELAEHPLVGEARGVGFIAALELVADKATRRFFPDRGDVGLICRDHCFSNGLVMRAVRDTMVIAPPLVMERAQIDELIEKAWRCLDLTARDLKNR